MIESPIVLIVIGCAILASCYFTVFIGLVTGKDKLEKQLNNELSGLEGRVDDYERRLGVLEIHAIDYLNSLGVEGSRQLKEIRALIDTAHELTEEIGCLIATHDYEALEEAKTLLGGGRTVAVSDGRGYSRVNNRRAQIPPNWEAHMEELIQSLGEKISNASQKSHLMGLPTRRKNKPTVAGLLEAGVKALTHELRAKQNPVRAALHKNNRTLDS